MNQSRPPIDDRLIPHLLQTTNMVRATCTIQQSPRLTDAWGQPQMAEGDYVDVVGLDSIPCMYAPLMSVRPTDSTETKTTTGVQDKDVYTIYLFSYHPDILKEWRVVTVDEEGRRIVWDIIGRDASSQGLITRLKVQLYSV